MGRFSRTSDADLQQSMELATEAAKEARSTGDRKREAAFHQDINAMVDETQSRGWKKGSGWRAGR
ncbi:MAG: hypothetical protein ACRDQ0_00030 [Pseudonocardia sp.]